MLHSIKQLAKLTPTKISKIGNEVIVYFKSGFKLEIEAFNSTQVLLSGFTPTLTIRLKDLDTEATALAGGLDSEAREALVGIYKSWESHLRELQQVKMAQAWNKFEESTK